jgi:thiamine-monophosphate kinase
VAQESDLIRRHFTGLGAARDDVLLGVGDDAAVLRAPDGCELVLTTDSLVEGVHFLPGSDPRSLGHRALAVNLSDCAAMGARPLWALLALTLPVADDDWLREFAAGFAALARAHEVALVGGNLTRGPLNIGVQLTGCVASGAAITRSGGRPGDWLCLTGTVGDAAAGRQPASGTLVNDDHRRFLRHRFEFPTPRVELGMALPGLASACIDISDGVRVDLERLAEASHCGLQIEVERLPLSAALRALHGENAWRLALSGGEDYELAIAVTETRLQPLLNRAAEKDVPCTPVGRLTAQSGAQWLRAGAVLEVSPGGFDHFAT